MLGGAEEDVGEADGVVLPGGDVVAIETGRCRGDLDRVGVRRAHLDRERQLPVLPLPEAPLRPGDDPDEIRGAGFQHRAVRAQPEGQFGVRVARGDLHRMRLVPQVVHGERVLAPYWRAGSSPSASCGPGC
ncbi:hypothetical protein ACFQ05_37825 [Amycolatopsis umgeniensis]|uniref:Uncharacterized protein n=1 Tax=Amycolatopsis umgeniensis TaxID=336628 RepID=A0A841ATH6_9PSEU|nr:hypothetical protein [Amycolatopsis umgeniensis]MBB5851186.1 hypothetical protein [Amycolatopsis umgeniensis]